MVTKDNMTHGNGSEFSRVGAQSRVVRAQEAVAGADYSLLMRILDYADNSDDVHDCVHWR